MLRTAVTPAVEAFGRASIEAIDTLTLFLNSSRRLVVISGAGISTESGIADYRSPGRPKYNPVIHNEFMKDEARRKRYWSRSMLGYPRMAGTRPSASHFALADLDRSGRVALHLTQNVDGLISKAGSNERRVVELHGTVHDVYCIACGAESPRAWYQQRLVAENAELFEQWQELQQQGHIQATASLLLDKPNASLSAATVPTITTAAAIPAATNPDGDIELNASDLSSFVVPPCDVCRSGVIKPQIVFFGDNVPLPRVQRAYEAVAHADGLLVVGTSLQVFSAYRFVRAARQQGTPIYIVNAGETRGDGDASFKVSALVGDALQRAVAGVAPLN